MDLARAYFLALKLRPRLPDKRLMGLLSVLERDILQSALDGGYSTDLIPKEQLLSYAVEGDIDIDPSHHEFRVLMFNALKEAINNLDDVQPAHYADLMSRLVTYYRDEETEPQTVVGFDEDVEDTALFMTGFSPLDTLLGEWVEDSNDSSKYVNKGIVPGIYTLQALEGAGKTYIKQAIAHAWSGSVLFYEAENGPKKIGKRKRTLAGVNLSNKKYIHGYYDIARIYDEVADNPDPERLIVLDSIQSVWGNGQGSDDYKNYERGYMLAGKMIAEGLCKFIIMSTHLKAGTDGYTLDSVSASRVLSKKTDALISVKKQDLLPNGYTSYEMYTVKNRDGLSDQRVTFSFRHEDGTVGKILTGGYA